MQDDYVSFETAQLAKEKGFNIPVNSHYTVKKSVWKTLREEDTNEDNFAFKHPAIFPEQLAHDHIRSWSNEGDLVYDPFMGSGTTAKMANLLKRNWVGSEISVEYMEIINKRLAQYVHRDHSSMLHILKKYGDDMRFNPQFRDIATKVNDILNRNNNV